MIKAKPILFNTEMIRAILDGKKTQTRRPMKPQPESGGHGNYPEWPSHKAQSMVSVCTRQQDSMLCQMIENLSPYGCKGDLLWVRETYADIGCRLTYRADDDGAHCEVKRWIPSIHMPRHASRLTLEIIDMRVERVQSISRKDALAEGIERWDDTFSITPYKNYRIGAKGEMKLHCSAPERSFMTMWQSVYRESWDKNEWVWVIEFKAHVKNIDDFLALKGVV